MSSRIRTRTIFLKKAVFANQLQNVTFEEYLKDAISQLKGKLPDVDRSFFIRLHCSDLDQTSKEGISLYFTQTFQGSETSTVDTQGDKTVSTLPPPSGQDFLEKDLSVFVINNSIITCSNGLSTTSLSQYFHTLFKEAQLAEDIGSFDISNVAHTDNLRLIEDVGVKNIDLDVQTYLATFEDITRQGLSSILSNLLGKKDSAIARNKENLRVRLILNPQKGLSQQAKDSVQTPMKNLAKIAVEEHEDHYTIELKDGSKLRPTDISVHEKVNLPAVGNSVDHKRLWLELKRFYEKYKNDPSII